MKWLKIIIACVCAVTLVFSVFVLSGTPDLSIEKITDISQTLILYDKNDELCACLNAGQNRIMLSTVPENIKYALLSAEDIRFYEHNGVDIKRIFGALFNDIKSGSLKEGASTLTQQLVKNSHLTNEKTFMRKAREIVLALELERLYDKDEILLMYVNFVYFGRGAYGIEAAAQAYFGISASELSVPQAAVLAGVLKAPNKYAPHIDYEKSLLRRNTVLKQMNKYGYISDIELEEYLSEEIAIIEKTENTDYGYFTDYVLEEAADKLGITVSDLLGGGYNVYTTQDSTLQNYMQELFAGEECFPDENTQGAFVALDNFDGSICALVGGRTHEGMRLYNRALCNRQPGSTIKPVLVYAPAFENGSVNAATLLNDTRTDFDGYSPTNFHDVYYGKVTVRKALSLSLNVPAVSLLLKNGIEYSKAVAEKFGIEFDKTDIYPAIALGGMAYGTSCLKLASAYRAFATGGVYSGGWCIRRITDGDGNTLYEHQSGDKRIISESTAYILTDILCDVSKQSKNALSAFGDEIACKTGTVGYESGYSDAWSCAYTADYTVCAWIGYDKTDSEHHLDESVTGSTYPSLIALKAHTLLRELYGCNTFTVPASVVKKRIDGYSLEAFGELRLANEGKLASTDFYEVFERDNAPTEYGEYWDMPKTPESFSVQINELHQAEISIVSLQSFAEYCVYKTDGTLLARLNGAEGRLLCATDEKYKQGDGYYVIPRHTSVYSGDEFLIGEKSEEIFP